MQGLKTRRIDKFQSDELKNIFSNNDLVLLTETWADEYSDLCINGYTHFQLNRSEYKRNTKRASGGVVSYVKKSLAFGISDLMLHKDSDDILWLRIEGAKLNLDGDLFICLCYNLPSDSSRQSLIDEDMFDRVCNYVTFIKNEYGNESHFLICGDMNARIADRDDFVPLDISTHMDTLPDDYVCDINLPRSTQDSGFNANGNLLLDFCKRSGFRIVNGRVGEDAGDGKCTYVGSRGSSLIDYVIADQDLFKYLSNFCVNDPDILSDHCVLNFVMNFELLDYDSASNTVEGENDIQLCNGKYAWDNDKANIFLNNLQSEGVKQQLNNITDSINQAASNEEIDVSVNSFTNLVGAIAEPFFKDINGSQNTKSAKSNFIYSEECEFKKLVFLDMLNKYRADKTDANRINMVRARTEFKAEVRQFKRELDRAKTKRLVDSKYRNAKEYWKLLKEAANISTGMTKSISANRFAEYFKAINNPDDAFF